MENKLGITSPAELAIAEERISKQKAYELFENPVLDRLSPGTFASLSLIHKFLFEDIYAFAGEIRHVNISKGNFRFASALYLHSALEHIDSLPHTTFDEIVEKYVEMNVAHPFREGNGRSMRIWLDLMFKHSLRLVVDWSKIDKSDYLSAMDRSPVKDIELNLLLKSALTHDIHDRDVYIKGIDTSYFYEIP